MSHRSYSSKKIKVPSLRTFRRQCYQFKMSYDIVEDLYNILNGGGAFYDFNSHDYNNNLVDRLQRKSKAYKYKPEETLQKQITYDKAAAAFVVECVKNGWVKAPTIEKDILTLNEAFQCDWRDWKAERNIEVVHNENYEVVPDFTGGLPPSDFNGSCEAIDFLRDLCKEDYIDDVRLYIPSIKQNLLKVRDLSQNIKAKLAYNKGKAKRDANEKTDFAQQRSNKSLLEAKFLAKSEYAYDLNTRLGRLASCQAQVLVPQKKARKKFARFILIDNSGSMQNYERYLKAASVVLDSVESVVNHGDTLHVALFGDDFLYKGSVTKENAHDILLTCCNINNYYTDNDCTDPLQNAWEILQENPDLEKLEIILLSDGIIRNFKPLDANCDCKVHFINLSGGEAQYEIEKTIEEHNGTMTDL